MDHRDFLKTSVGVLAGSAIFNGLIAKTAEAAVSNIKGNTVSNVYFSNKLDAETLIKLYEKVNQNISGKVAIKLHTGEQHGPNILPRDWVKQFQAQVPNSAIVETNTWYKGDRYTTKDHRETLKVNGWTFCPVDIMDEDGETMIPVKDGKIFK